MLKKTLIALATGMVALSAYAVDASKVEKSFELKDGSTVYIFKDGKMGMESKTGQSAHMKEGVIMETKDGQKIMMKGNEIWRMEALLHRTHKEGTLGTEGAGR